MTHRAGIRIFLLLGAIGGFAGQAGERVTTTIYVGRHFEVRDHDQPVKYVFDGDTRVARITGSLSANRRVQRLRLHPGWNLVSVGVTAAKLVQQLLPALTAGNVPEGQAMSSVYLWDPSTRGYERVEPDATVRAGSVLWIKASKPEVVSIVGDHVESQAAGAPAGGGYVPSYGLEARSLDLPEGVGVWTFDSATGRWEAGFVGDLAPFGKPPAILSPGSAIYLHTDQPVVLEAPDPALSIVYYHPDHLGSASVITDAEGKPIRETAYYPFGATRYDTRFSAADTHYGFSQKERDEETGLEYFGHRYLHPLLGRWVNPDPMGEDGGGMNPYAYVNQSPLKHVDPDGANIKVTESVNRKTKQVTYQIHLKAVVLDVSSKKFDQQELQTFAAKVKSKIEESFRGKKDKYQWSASVDIRVARDWSDVQKDDHVFRLVDHTKTRAGGSARIGGMRMDIAAHLLRAPTPDQVDKSIPANRNYTWEFYQSPEGVATHEFGHSAGLHHDDTKPNLMQTGDTRRYDNRDVELSKIKEIAEAYRGNRLNNRIDVDEVAPRR